MSFTNSTFTFINCENPSERFSVTNDEIRQMELKINVVHKESENWKHIANHLYNFHTKIGYLGQPKSNRNVYPAEYKELLRLKDTSYRDAVESKPWNVAYGMPKVDVKAESHLKRHKSWQNYTAKVVSNTDDSINNPSVHQSDYSNNLAMQMMKKLNVDTSAEYVTSAQLHMKDRFRSDVHSESSASESEFEIAEARVKKPLSRKNAVSEDVETTMRKSSSDEESSSHSDFSLAEAKLSSGDSDSVSDSSSGSDFEDAEKNMRSKRRGRSRKKKKKRKERREQVATDQKVEVEENLLV